MSHARPQSPKDFFTPSGCGVDGAASRLSALRAAAPWIVGAILLQTRGSRTEVFVDQFVVCILFLWFWTDKVLLFLL